MQTGHVGEVISDRGRQYLRMQLADDIGPIRLRALIDHFGSIDAVLAASMAELQRVDGVGPRVAESVFRAGRGDAVEYEIERAASCGLRIVCGEDPDYPRPLLNISDPPICLCVRGTLVPTDAVAVAVVGTRRCSHYGREQAMRFGELLGGAGFTVVSGLARGIDSHAHRGALNAGGRTIAVLGNGLATIYPPEHIELADAISHAGAVVSELPVDASPEAKNFPRRNRIIVGLALGVLIVEAGKRSGALITARLAADYNREVFGIPGRVDQPDHTAGVHRLIRDGHAKLVTCLEDVLDELGDVGEIMRQAAPGASFAPADESAVEAPASSPLHADEQTVLQALADGLDDADRIHEATGLEPARIATTITSLQLKGLLTRLPGNRLACRRQGDAR